MKNSGIDLSPVACRPEAYALVRRTLKSLDSTAGLVHCVFGVALHAFEDARLQDVDRELDRLAARVLSQCPSAAAGKLNPLSLLSHLHEVLFEVEGFGKAPEERFYNPLNSYLPAVFELRQGLPVTLCLVYKAVAERVGLQVEGIFSRGHFLVRVHDGRSWMIVDPTHGGRVLTVAEACALISSTIGEQLAADPRHLPPATHKQWLRRVIVNLVHVFQAMHSSHDLLAMRELLSLVDDHLD
jgi:regulator of sirC expression with transglutaminase-like and TPR domain